MDFIERETLRNKIAIDLFATLWLDGQEEEAMQLVHNEYEYNLNGCSCA